jgi:hypothetical protein
MYKLEGEAELVFSMLVTADGNDSLKRVLRRGAHEYDDEGNPLPGKSNERPDPRLAGAGEPYFLSRERVDRWAKDRFKEFMTPDGDPPPAVTPVLPPKVWFSPIHTGWEYRFTGREE